jgi:Ca-activated chloride channel family protein
MSTTEMYREPVRTMRTMMMHVPFFLRLIVIGLVIVCMARPQTPKAFDKGEVEGVDIIMAIDISTSMLASDIRPSRIDAAKMVGCEFIQNCPNDNIGLVLFGGEAFMQCPLTTDHTSLLTLMNGVSCKLAAAGVVAPGTAIGMGVANSVSHLQQSKSKSKVIILLTDGIDNTGEISPQMAAELAKENGIRVYTISVGGSEPALEQATDESIDGVGGVQKAPDVLKNIADITGGKYYHANSRQKLKEIYGDIDKLEKSKLKKKNFDKLHDVYQLFALIAILLLVVEILIKYVWLRRIP